MTDKPPNPGERSSDLAALAADTLLLDTLGRGEPGPADDRVASLLAAWRVDLAADLPTVESDPATVDLELARLVAAGTGDPRRRTDRARRITRRVLGTAAAVLIVGGLVVAAGHATPGNPLWPITRVMYPEQADNVAAEHSLAQARQAAAEGRHDDARRLLAQAERLIARLSQPGRAQRLRAELTTVRGMIPATGPNTSTPAAPTPAATGPAGDSAATPTAGGPVPQPTGEVPEPRVTSGGAPALPPVVPVPPPALPVPPPALPVPSPPAVAVPPPGLRIPPVVPPLGPVPPLGGGLLPGSS